MPSIDRLCGFRAGWCAAALIAGCALPSSAFGEEVGRCARVAATVREKADVALERASEAASAARAWVSENVTREKIESVASAAKQEATEVWRAAVESARDTYEESLGVRAYQAPCVPGEAGTWRRLGADERTTDTVVLLIHGLDEPGDVWEDLAPQLARAGHTVLRFDYANDQAISQSACDLIGALTELRASMGVRRVSLVCHSMGGLVARDALTREDAYAGYVGGPNLPRVEHFIPIAAPNQGAWLAPLRPVCEAREQVARFLASGARKPETFLGFTADGDGRAGRDLTPGSDYLRTLNARPAFSPVLAARTTNIIAEFRPVDRDQVFAAAECALARECLGEHERHSLRDACMSLVLGLGDGVVPDKSASLTGVTDEVRVRANHRSVVRRVPLQTAVLSFLGQPMGEPPAIEVVLDRLSDQLPARGG